MVCAQCGKKVLPNQKLCEECLESSSASLLDLEETKDDQKRKARKQYSEFAGFWLRFFAFLVDAALLNVFIVMFSLTFPSTLLQLLHFLGECVPTNDLHDFSILASIGIVIAMIPTMICFMLFTFIYNPLFESSSYQATPGKMFFRLVVVSTSGKRISFGRALLRNLGRLFFIVIPVFIGAAGTALSALGASGLGAFFAGLVFLSFMLSYGGQYLFAAFTPRKQAIHDFIGDTYVVRQHNLRFSQYAWRAMLGLFLYLLIFTLFSSSDQNSKAARKPSAHLSRGSLSLALR